MPEDIYFYDVGDKKPSSGAEKLAGTGRQLAATS
jgi:hypothetical protein